MIGLDGHHALWNRQPGRKPMSMKLFVAIPILALSALANAEISAYVEPVYEGFLTEYPTTYVFSYDLKVSITEGDAWTVAGGPDIGEPWIRLYGGVFFQHPMGSAGSPDPYLFWWYPDLRYDTFYTTHLAWPNTDDMGGTPGFAVGPIDNPTNLIADWFWTPDGNDYPGDFTIARFTVIAPPDADPATTYAHIDMLVGSREGGLIPFQATVGIPEPGSLALLALGGLALLRRRRQVVERSK